MEAKDRIVVSNVLCYIVNKSHRYHADSLKSLITHFYSTEEISDAKDLLVKEMDALKLEKTLKITRHRRDGNHVYDTDDIRLIISFLDENKQLGNLPTFVATSPDNMPSVRLAEGDLSVLLTKFASLEENYKSLMKEVVELRESVRQLVKPQVTTAPIADSGVTIIPGVAANNKGSKDKLQHSNYSLDFPALSRPNAELQIKSHGAVGPVIANPLLRKPTWGSTASANDSSDVEDMSFTQVISRAQRRENKRKNTSPIQSCINGGSVVEQRAECRPPVTKKLATGLNVEFVNTEGSQRSHEFAQQSNKTLSNSASAPQFNARVTKITGQAKCMSLKAAAVDTSPVAVFCISNISQEYKTRDIRQHCSKLGVTVRFCFDISLEGSRSAAFKLAVGEDDRYIIEDERSWPERVIVRNWRYNGRQSADGAQRSSHYGEHNASGGDRSSYRSGTTGGQAEQMDTTGVYAMTTTSGVYAMTTMDGMATAETAEMAVNASATTATGGAMTSSADTELVSDAVATMSESTTGTVHAAEVLASTACMSTNVGIVDSEFGNTITCSRRPVGTRCWLFFCQS